MLHALIIDDEKNIRLTLSACLEGLGCKATAVGTAEAALSALEAQPYDLCFLDLRLSQGSGLDLLPRLLAACPGLTIVLMTAYATIETAVEAIKRGARDYLPKPFSPAQIRKVVDEARERQALSRRVEDLESRLNGDVPEVFLDTASPGMRAALELLRRAAASDAAVLLRGESGTGKGVFARALHAQSPRAARPFVVVNCPTLSGELLASELFGHAKGAFTGAVRDQAGKVEMAQGGSLFLDEVSEISPAMQAKLLRFLQDKTFERVGETKTRRADVRVVTATNRDLAEEVRAGRFREDLLYRINVVEVAIPPLRERPEDLEALTRHFLNFFARSLGRPVPELSPAARAALAAHPWPGNIRELRNAMERALIVWPEAVIEAQALPVQVAARTESAPRLGGDHSLEQVEREHIRRVLARSGSLEEAARLLDIDPSTLWRKRKKYEEGD
jgi:NtrC-family two-component system response regulator AlgB